MSFAIDLNHLKSNVKTDKLSLLLDVKGNLKVGALLTSNTKLKKATDGADGINIGLTLTPFNFLNQFVSSAPNFCEFGKKCYKTCLFNVAGRHAIKVKGTKFSATQKAAVKRALMYMFDKEAFQKRLLGELLLLESSLKDGEKVFLRLNVMSDINHNDLIAFIRANTSKVVCYDYTKDLSKVVSNTLSVNYAYSLQSSDRNNRFNLSLELLDKVKNDNVKLSILCDKKDKAVMIKKYPSIFFDGDKSDLFFINSGYVSLLAPKALTNKNKEALTKHMTFTVKDLEQLQGTITDYLINRIL